jgi:hypothetical protein
MIDKNEMSSNEKKVQENSSDLFGDKNDANFGDTVTFQSKVKIPLRASDVIYHDKINSTAFTLTGIKIEGATTDQYNIYTKVATTLNVIGSSPASTVTTETYPLVDTDDDGTPDTQDPIYTDTTYGEDSFAILFKNSWTEGKTSDTEVVITYTATLTTDATVGDQSGLTSGEGNDNIAWVTYGAKQKSAYDRTRTYTWSYDLFKYAKYDNISTVTPADNQYKANTAYKIGDNKWDDNAAHKDGYIRNDGGSASQFWIKAKPLSGATFTMKRVDTEVTKDGDAEPVTASTDNSLTFVLKTAGTTTTAAVYRLAVSGESIITDGPEDPTGNTTYPTGNLVTPASGLITIEGLDASDEYESVNSTTYPKTTNKYVITETVAPTGYYLKNIPSI